MLLNLFGEYFVPIDGRVHVNVLLSIISMRNYRTNDSFQCHKEECESCFEMLKHELLQ
jgi:hypothetical protein